MIFRPSGGLRYHLRALRRRPLWRPFATDIAAWLEAWAVAKDQLILIGPSAGYTLPTAWLRKFHQIDAYDLDPLAGPIFRRIHRGAKVNFYRQNIFWNHGRLTLEPLRALRARHPRTPILFANVLGQVLLEGPANETEWAAFLTALRAQLESGPWASYHDLVTYEGAQGIDHLMAGAWSQGLNSRQFRWQLTPGSLHVIEGVTYAP